MELKIASPEEEVTWPFSVLECGLSLAYVYFPFVKVGQIISRLFTLELILERIMLCITGCTRQAECKADSQHTGEEWIERETERYHVLQSHR